MSSHEDNSFYFVVLSIAIILNGDCHCYDPPRHKPLTTDLNRPGGPPESKQLPDEGQQQKRPDKG